MIEHVADVIRTMEEFHRLLRTGGEVYIATPHYTDFSSFCDPTHRWHLNSFSLRYFGQDDAGFGYYSRARFREKSVRVKLLALWRYLGFELLVNAFPRFRRFWEHYLCYLVRGKVIEWRLMKEDAAERLWRLSDWLRHRARLRRDDPRHAWGARGEDLAHRFLQKRGYRVVARNWRAEDGSGELDLVAWDGPTLVVMEVKTRASTDFGLPEEAVDGGKRASSVANSRAIMREADVPLLQQSGSTSSASCLSAKPEIGHYQRRILPVSYNRMSPLLKDARASERPDNRSMGDHCHRPSQAPE